MSRRYVRDLRGRFSEVGGSGSVSATPYLTRNNKRVVQSNAPVPRAGDDVLGANGSRGKIEQTNGQQSFVRHEDGSTAIYRPNQMHKIIADHDNSVVSKDDLASRHGKTDSTLGADRAKAREDITANIDKMAGPYVGRNSVDPAADRKQKREAAQAEKDKADGVRMVMHSDPIMARGLNYSVGRTREQKMYVPLSGGGLKFKNRDDAVRHHQANLAREAAKKDSSTRDQNTTGAGASEIPKATPLRTDGKAARADEARRLEAAKARRTAKSEGQSGPSNNDKIKNTATMFGEGSKQHEEAKRRFGTPDETPVQRVQRENRESYLAQAKRERAPKTAEDHAANYRLHGFSPAEAEKMGKKKFAEENPVSPDDAAAQRAAAKRERARARRLAKNNTADLSGEGPGLKNAASREAEFKLSQDNRPMPSDVLGREAWVMEATPGPERVRRAEMVRAAVKGRQASDNDDLQKSQARAEAKRERARKRREAAKASPGK